MVIGIDGNEANVAEKVGISEYAFQLLREFERLKTKEIQFRIYLKETPRSDLPRESEGWRYHLVGPSKLWTQIGLPFDLLFGKSRPDIFFSPTHYAPRFSPIPTVISVMDLSYIHFPQLFNKKDLYQLTNWTKYSVRYAAKVLTISDASRDDIIKTYHLDPEKVVVTYPGIKMQGKNSRLRPSSSDVVKKYGVAGDYILFVGTLQPRKNIAKLIEAFLFVSKDHQDLSLVVIGKKGWMYEDIVEAPKKVGLEEKVKFLSYVSDEDLAHFYKNALCFVLPSLYEGFGLPVLEAMQNGCPVIVSKVSSLPEVGGDAAVYIDPQDVSDIAEKIQKIIDDPKKREEMREKGYEQVKKFSWEKTAKKTLEILQEVIKK